MKRFQNKKHTIVFNTLFSFSFLIILFSCKKEQHDTPTNQGVSKISYLLSNELESKSSYFTVDSIKNFNLIDTASFPKFSTYNWLGSSINQFGLPEQSILNFHMPKKPITKFSIDESFTYRVVASWDINSNNRIVDSIVGHSLKLDTSYIVNINRSTNQIIADSILYVNFILVKRLGTIQIDFTNKDLKKYLYYSSSLFNDSSAEGINLSPTQFYNIYGQKFCSSITLGVSTLADIEVMHIDLKNANKDSVIKESISIFTKMVNQKSTWNDQIKSSKNFKRAQYFINYMTEMPGGGFITSLEKIISQNDSIERSYQKASFSILSLGCQPYTKLYPKYNFIKSN